MQAANALARLQRIGDAAAAGRALAPEDGAMLARAIRDFQKNGTALEISLGLVGNWRTSSRNADRDALLLDEAGKLPGRNRADALRARLNRYAATGYIRHRNAAEAPADQRGLHEILDANQGEPPSERTIQRALAKSLT